jgi:hypothetical protein
MEVAIMVPLAFCLDQFEQAIHNDPDILGVVYIGSLGRGSADRFSDLDIEVWLTGAAFAAGVPMWIRVLGYLGEIQFTYHADSLVRGFVGPERQRVDLEIRRRDDLQPHPRYAQASIVKDTDNVLAQVVAQSPAEQVIVTYDQAVYGKKPESPAACGGSERPHRRSSRHQVGRTSFFLGISPANRRRTLPAVRGLASGSPTACGGEIHCIQEAIDSQIYLALQNARGATWEATGEISYRCTELYTVLASLRGRRSYGFRFVETLLSPSEEALLRAAWPAEPIREENRRAARALWAWTRHVWAEAERSLGRELQVILDEKQFLDAIDTIYTWT